MRFRKTKQQPQYGGKYKIFENQNHKNFIYIFVINNNAMETIIVHPKNNEEQKVIKAFLEALKIKFENPKTKSEESDYSPEFVEMVEQNRKDYKAGKGIKVNLDDIWK
jgi:hypothetical protein